MRRKIWLTGSGGFIGSYLMRVASRMAPKYEVIGLQRSEFDLLNFTALDRAFARDEPAAIIHCAALSRTADCQANPGLARQVNFELTRHLAELAANSSLIFFSSDLVFDGLKGDYVETDPVNPRSVYGETKAEAEAFVLRTSSHTVVRTSLNAGVSASGSRTFNEEITNAWMVGRPTQLFHDEYRSPLGASVTAWAVWELAASGQTGLFHLAGAERLSRVQIGELLARYWRKGMPKIESRSLRDYSGPPRCPDTSLNCAKLQAYLSQPLPRFSHWLEQNLAEVAY